MAKKHKYGIINTYDVVPNPDEAFCALNKYSGVYWLVYLWRDNKISA
jgi:hypothetical protein